MLLAEYEKSGMSGAGFAEHVGVKYQTFATWAQEKRKRALGDQKALGEKQPVQWVEAVRSDAEVKASGLEISLAGGARMEISDSNGAFLASEVLRHLGEARVC